MAFCALNIALYVRLKGTTSWCTKPFQTLYVHTLLWLYYFFFLWSKYAHIYKVNHAHLFFCHKVCRIYFTSNPFKSLQEQVNQAVKGGTRKRKKKKMKKIIPLRKYVNNFLLKVFSPQLKTAVKCEESAQLQQMLVRYGAEWHTGAATTLLWFLSHGWMRKLSWLPHTKDYGRVGRLSVGATGSGCLAWVLDKHSVGRCQRLH